MEGATSGEHLPACFSLQGTPTADLPPWLLGVVTVGPVTLLGAASASGSLALARMAERRESLGAGAAVYRRAVPGANSSRSTPGAEKR